MADRSTKIIACATVIAAAAAAATLPMSSCHHRATLEKTEKALSHSDAALRQARIEHADQLRNFEEERKGWEKSLALAEKDSQERARQFKEQIRVAIESAAEQQRQGQTSMAEQRRIWEEEKQQRLDIRKSELAPRITPLQCCNYQVAVTFDSSNPTGPGQVRIPLTAQQKRVFPDHYNVGYIAKLVNLGGGPAESLIVTWIVNGITYEENGVNRDDIVSDTENSHLRYSTADTIPNHVRSGGEVEIRHLPLCILNDYERKVREVSGFVEFHCYHILEPDVPVRIWYDFWIRPDYTPKPMEGISSPPPFLHVHIGNMRPVQPFDGTVRTYAPDEVFPPPIPVSAPAP